MKNNILHIRITKDLLNALKEISKKENRTFSNLIETILKDYLNNYNIESR